MISKGVPKAAAVECAAVSGVAVVDAVMAVAHLALSVSVGSGCEES